MSGVVTVQIPDVNGALRERDGILLGHGWALAQSISDRCAWALTYLPSGRCVQSARWTRAVCEAVAPRVSDVPAPAESEAYAGRDLRSRAKARKLPTNLWVKGVVELLDAEAGRADTARRKAMDGRRVYAVHVTQTRAIDVYVIAKDKGEARRIACADATDDLFDDGEDTEYAATARLPGMVDGEAATEQVWGTDVRMTAHEAWEIEHALKVKL